MAAQFDDIVRPPEKAWRDQVDDIVRQSNTPSPEKAWRYEVQDMIPDVGKKSNKVAQAAKAIYELHAKSLDAARGMVTNEALALAASKLDDLQAFLIGYLAND